MAALMKKPEVKIRSGHLSPLPILALHAAGLASAALWRPLVLFPPELGRPCGVLCAGDCG